MILQDRLIAACAALTLACFLFFGSSAFASEQAIADNWKQLDANGDGKVTVAENRANADQAFKKVDTNSDGTVSQDEYVAAMKALGQ